MYTIGYHSTIKKMNFCHLQQYGGPWKILSEIYQTEKNKYCMISFTCGV